MQNPMMNADISVEEEQSSLQAYFRPNIAPDDIEEVLRLKRAQPLLQDFTAHFHGGFDGVLVRMLVLKELVADVETSTLSRADIHARLGYLEPEAIETVLTRLRNYDLLAWDAAQGVYRVTSTARNVLAAVDSHLVVFVSEDEAEMGFFLLLVVGVLVVGGVF